MRMCVVPFFVVQKGLCRMKNKEAHTLGCLSKDACVLSRLSRVRLFATPQTVAHQAPPWNSPGKNAGVGCHFLLHFKW